MIPAGTNWIPNGILQIAGPSLMCSLTPTTQNIRITLKLYTDNLQFTKYEIMTPNATYETHQRMTQYEAVHADHDLEQPSYPSSHILR